MIKITFQQTSKSKKETYTKFVPEDSEHTPDFGILYIKKDSPLAKLKQFTMTIEEPAEE